MTSFLFCFLFFESFKPQNIGCIKNTWFSAGAARYIIIKGCTYWSEQNDQKHHTVLNEILWISIFKKSSKNEWLLKHSHQAEMIKAMIIFHPCVLSFYTLHTLSRYSLIAFDERVTFWLQRVRSLPCACVYVALFVCRLAYNHYAIAHTHTMQQTCTHKAVTWWLKPKSYSLVEGNRSIDCQPCFFFRFLFFVFCFFVFFMMDHICWITECI